MKISLTMKQTRNIDFALQYLQDNKNNYKDPNLDMIVSMLASSRNLSANIINYYGGKWLYLFSPNKYVCEELFKYYEYEDEVLVCCIMYKFNDLYFKHAPYYFKIHLFEIACKTNNVEVYNHLKSLNPDANLTLEFDYSLYLYPN